jgi:Tfp pilus assembly PilM family ATPase/Tfp pilus assembly protein PilN
MARSTYPNKKGLGISLEDGLLTAFYWKRKGNTIKIIDSLFLSSLILDESVTLGPEDYQKLTEFLNQYGSKSEEVIVEIPRNAVLVRYLKLPSLSDQDLEQMLSYEVERHIPFSKSDIYYDSQALNRDEKEARVLLVAAKKHLVDACLDLVKTDKVKPTAVFVSSFSLLNLLLTQYPGKAKSIDRLFPPSPIGIVDITSHHVEVNFLCGKNLENSFIIPIRERPWQELLRKMSGKPGKVSEEFDHWVNLGDLPQLSEPQETTGLPAENGDYLLQSFIKWLISEVGKALLKHEFMGKGRVEKLILIQSRILDVELEPVFRQYLDIPVEVADFSRIIKVKKSPQMALLCSKTGLTLKDTEAEYFKLDLFPRFLEVAKPPKLYLTATLVTLIFLLLGGTYLGKSYKDRKALHWVQQEIVSMEPQVKSAIEMKTQLKGLKEQIETLAYIENQGPRMLDILKELTLKTPEYAWLKGIKVVDTKVDIWGYSNHSKGGQASDLIRLFSDSVLFEKPSFSEPIQTIRQDTETFKMTMEISKLKQRQKASEEASPEKSSKKVEKDREDRSVTLTSNPVDKPNTSPARLTE